MAVISLGDKNKDRLETEARRITATLELAGQEAVYQSLLLGLRIDDREYSYVYYENGKWTPYEDPLLRKREIPEDFEFELLVEGQAAQSNNTVQDPLTPQVGILPSSERTPFELTVRIEDYPTFYVLKGTASGKLTLTEESSEQL